MKNFKKIIFWNQLNSYEQDKILSRPHLKNSSDFRKTVKKIINNVKNLGDQALKDYSYLFDKYDCKKLQISNKQIIASSSYLSSELKNSINIAKNNITSFHKAQQSSSIDIETQIGVRCQQIHVPLNKIGIYIPGGTAPLFSTVLMLAIPAKISGCNKIVLCSPPPISNEILYSAHICGVDTIFQVGGAQAIAALAFGTKTIPKVDKIFGPGNNYVTEAKLQVSSMFNGTSIDMLAGPSELLIIADNTANPNFIAADLLSQAEHGISSQVILLTPFYELAKEVLDAINKQLKNLSRISEILVALQNSAIIITKNLLECVKISNIYSPEHLIIQTRAPRETLYHISNASSIFLGSWSPESVGDYASGTNHVLPTYGKSVTDSALGLDDFQKRILIQELTPQGFKNLSNTVEILSSAERLEAHKNAVKIRVEYLEGKYGK
ncbi:histidinol dehydrogenase [Buchnera aphidicola (Macrosiphoniella sanborni)]|uniref:Histidinol dehydrogenase n=1 Tax=Buchnera aphidicola (Macrosiphoniella sanborni) TaxID=1241865 RepID=A0A4D6Y384_9GAMM|nr:histidinol dehydrogenase [Buchnera aphidicola]QCI23667.1 histidinol dehydrogenase [Buchnera aphidicola (Macrosiphoniella sanborni)]